MRAYSLLLIKTCHKRGAFAMGGMAAQIPIKNDLAANEAALAKVRADKDREATDGHDGTWVAHPGLVAIAKEAFDKSMKTPNQIHKKRDDVQVAAKDLLNFQPKGPITEHGLRININIGITHKKRITICFRKNSNSLNSHFAAGTHYAKSNFTTIGDKNLFHRKYLV